MNSRLKPVAIGLTALFCLCAQPAAATGDTCASIDSQNCMTESVDFNQSISAADNRHDIDDLSLEVTLKLAAVIGGVAVGFYLKRRDNQRKKAETERRPRDFAKHRSPNKFGL